MSIFVQLANVLLDIVRQFGYLGIFIAMLIEGIITPIPSAFILPFAGLLAQEGGLNVVLVVIVAASGATVGSTGAYLIGLYLGRPFLLKYGRYLRIEERHLDMVDRWFERWGTWAVLLANSFTGFRSIIAFPAGIARMSLRRFIPFTFAGATVWTTILVGLGYFLGRAALDFAEGLESFDIIVLAGLAVFLVGFFLFRRWRKGQRARAAVDP